MNSWYIAFEKIEKWAHIVQSQTEGRSTRIRPFEGVGEIVGIVNL